MNVFSFEKLTVYQKSLELVEKTYSLIMTFPSEERFALCDQIRRSVVSVPSNIAEQSGRTSSKEKIHFIEYSFGSLMECYCQLQIALRLRYINDEELRNVKPLFFEISRLLSGLKQTISGKRLNRTEHDLKTLTNTL